MQAKTERFEMRLDFETLDGVDKWRHEQDDVPSRSEAIRRLIEVGIGHSQGPSFNTTGTEKLILLMLTELHEHFSVSSEFDPQLIQSAIYGGHSWGLEWQYRGIFSEKQRDQRAVAEVVDVLEMWSALERSFVHLSEAERARLRTEARPFGDEVEYPGFDGNNESEHLSIAAFMIKDLERFPEFSERAHLNSHSPTLDMHRRMLAKFAQVRRLAKRGVLGINQLIEVMRARGWDSGDE